MIYYKSTYTIDTLWIGLMMSKIELTDTQRRNLEILVFDALFYIKKKRHSLTEDEVNELLTILQIDPKKKVSKND